MLSLSSASGGRGGNTEKGRRIAEEFQRGVVENFGMGGGGVDCWGVWGDVRGRMRRGEGGEELGEREARQLKNWGGGVSWAGGMSS